MSSIFNLFRSSSASDFSLPYARKTADWNIVLWLLVPAWLLIWLWTNPPHGFDLAFEHQFYVNNAWPLHADGRIEFWLHFMPKVISGVLFACVLGALTYLHQCRRAAVILGDHEDAAHCNLILSRLYYAVGAALLCVGLLWWLKQSTGVSCPWSVTEFGGSAAVADPGQPFLPKPGRCWPSGAAGQAALPAAASACFRSTSLSATSGPDLPVCCSHWHSFRVSAQGSPAWWWERTSRRMFLPRWRWTG